ncbi:ATP-dependent DNA helicase UvrD2 [Streptoalloteichus hindustanus]|uniref:ATP-dependent DNA helicase UvrD2 n=1 Tax=Streptoalloteichus hindustanus TaxID=2017 RepID=A0A1M5JA36_STRHI|nr:ATP-dependent DNA helicase UvrD2 [Streptoalloteichus hindustanus]SHG37428.1 ATP-dependent DNA helicase, Rep family [Streptoalloteichus hindustanus]
MDAANELLEGLDPEQRAAVVAPRGPVCVLAGAGTGKTRTITRRIAHLVHRGHVAPGQVLAVTFTARAAGEMRTRLRALGAHGVQAKTFHAAALRQLRYFWPRVVDDEPWQLVEHKLRLVGQAAHRAGAPTERESLRDFASEIEWSKASLVTPEDYPAVAARVHRDTPGPAEQVALVYATYEQLKMRARVLDFDDLLLHTAAALEEHADVAGEFRDRYRCFVVDEYQDVTPLQQRVLDAWLGNRDDLTVVGDANQTIYSFAGATPRWLLDFGRRFPEATTVRLERDYRSTPQVVSLANRVIGAARGRPAGSRLRLVGQRPPGPEPEFAEHDDEPAEAAAVALRIRKLIDEGVPASEVAVLFRVNAQSEVYEQALAELDIPYQVRGGERFFARPEVRQAMQALRVAASSSVPSLAPVSAPSDEDAPAPSSEPSPVGETLDAQVRAVLVPLGLTEQPPAGGATRERWESLRALVELAEELVTVVPDADLARFAQELDVRAEAQHPPTVEGVTLASLHAAKGLEWDAVFLVGLVEGTLPIQHAGDDEEAVEEERRLLYVGVTRAREHLSLSWALSRSPGGRRHRRRSRFLYGLVPENHPAALPVRGRGRDGAPSRNSLRDETRRRCRTCGGALVGTMAVKLGRCADCPSNVDEELLARLRAWRTDRAKQLKVPAYVVFTDATLTAIAEQRPADEAGLVAIPGIGAAKLDRYGADVIALVTGAFSPDPE